jgi:hypothetical protein
MWIRRRLQGIPQHGWECPGIGPTTTSSMISHYLERHSTSAGPLRWPCGVMLFRLRPFDGSLRSRLGLSVRVLTGTMPETGWGRGRVQATSVPRFDASVPWLLKLQRFETQFLAVLIPLQSSIMATPVDPLN